jgi:integrase/recombinase XerC
MTTTRLPKPLSEAELARVHRAASDRPDVQATITWLRETGLRIAEACSVTTEEARAWDRPPWWCRRQICPIHSPAVHVVGKGSKPRLVPLTRRALAAADVLLTSSTNGHLLGVTDRGVRYLFERVGTKAGIHLHPHRLRHQFAFDLIEGNCPIEVVADLMGHSTVDITRLYYKSSRRTLSRAMRSRRRWRARR